MPSVINAVRTFQRQMCASMQLHGFQAVDESRDGREFIITAN